MVVKTQAASVLAVSNKVECIKESDDDLLDKNNRTCKTKIVVALTIKADEVLYRKNKVVVV